MAKPRGVPTVRWEVPPSRRLVFVLVLALVAMSVLVTWLVDWRVGGYVLALTLAVAAFARAVFPEKYCLGLLVRTRQFDVVVNAGLALAILLLATTIRH